MADGRWAMTKAELDSVAAGFEMRDNSALPNYKVHRPVDNRDGSAEQCCAFCGEIDITTGSGGYGEGFSYRSAICKVCGGVTDFVYKDDAHKFF